MSSERILIADDDSAFLDLMSLHLRKRGFDVETARDGVEALQYLRNNGPFAVMVTDMMMPGMSGLELLRRARGLDPRLEVVVITAAGSTDMAVAALREHGAFDYLTKPLEMISELSLAVERAIAHRRLKLEREALRDQVAGGNVGLRTLLSASNDAVIAADEHDVLNLVNPAAARLLTGVRLSSNTSLGDLPQPLVDLVRRWRSLDPTRPAQVEVHWPEGRVNAARLAPISVSGRKPNGWVMVLHDITYQKHLEVMLVRQFGTAAVRARALIQRAQSALRQLRRGLANGKPIAPNAWEDLERMLDRVHASLDIPFALSAANIRMHGAQSPVDLLDFFRRHGEQIDRSLEREIGHPIQWVLANDLPAVLGDYGTLRRLLRHMIQWIALRSPPGEELRFSARAQDGWVWMEVSEVLPGEDGSPLQAPTRPVKKPASEQAEIEAALVRMLIAQLEGQVWHRELMSGAEAVSVCLPAAESQLVDR